MLQSNPLTQALGPDNEYAVHLGRVNNYPCFTLYIVSKWDQTNDIHLSGLST